MVRAGITEQFTEGNEVNQKTHPDNSREMHINANYKPWQF